MVDAVVGEVDAEVDVGERRGDLARKTFLL